jgi:hypothetical protein
MDIGGFGTVLTIFASTTFPAGLTITEFADDADPVDSPSIQIRDKAMGLNGRLITWGKAVPIGLTINIIPNSEDDINLNLLFDSNRVGRGKRPVDDTIDATLIYPDGTAKNFQSGSPTDYMPTNAIASSARFKSKPYVFAFESMN